MREVVASTGAAGGHGTMAGARLFVPITSARVLEEEFTRLVTKLSLSIGQGEVTPARLLTEPPSS